MTTTPQKSLFGPEPLPWEAADREDILCADVIFNRPLDTPFQYRIPDELRGRLKPGQRVKVPLGRGNSLVVGFCVGVSPPTVNSLRKLKSVESLIDDEPLLTPGMLKLTRWIAERYLCGWGQVLDSVVPAGVKNQAGTREVLLLRVADDVREKLGGRELSDKQTAVLDVLTKSAKPLTLDQVAKRAGCGTGPIAALRKSGLVETFHERREADGRDPTSTAGAESEPPITLNPEQQRVLDRILVALRERLHKTFVLFGVTGSGKTEVYIRAIQEVVSYGRQAIVLVPEISLTPQTIRRFRSRFKSVAVLHSHLSDSERHRFWQRIARGEVEVIVGARSAVFAPAPHLGLIVIDEEHETTFKQDSTPRYHARDVARQRAELENIPLILGSATPTLESWSRAARVQSTSPLSPLGRGVGGEGRDDELLRLPNRVAGRPMPPVHIVDMRLDPHFQHGGAIGRALQFAMQESLAAGGQVILFLNIRGYSPVLFCRSCGKPVKCPHCDITLTWHKSDNRARCHFCEFDAAPPTACPNCKALGLKLFGIGTQRLEQEVKARFPKHACLRMDSDSMRRHGSHEVALESFRRGDVRILLGTQMIAKGLDFPNVTLVGVIDADTLLHQPDLRASERTFQLIAQVAGRTGRSARGGKVLVQTCSPTEPAIVLASRHNFEAFARAELAHRRETNSPPFQHWARVIVRGPDDSAAQAAARQMADAFRSAISELSSPIRLLGPAPAPIARLQNNFRYHFQLAAESVEPIQQLWHFVSPSDKLVLPKDVEFTVDVDPISLR
jgi:primosomal protein N' (replication factor Y)